MVVALFFWWCWWSSSFSGGGDRPLHLLVVIVLSFWLWWSSSSTCGGGRPLFLVVVVVLFFWRWWSYSFFGGLAEEVADLPAADPDVPRRHVGGGADVAEQLGHEALAEAHDLVVGAALGIEVGPALAAADRLAGERVLERLLEAEELEGAEADGRVEAQTTLPTFFRPGRAIFGCCATQTW